MKMKHAEGIYTLEDILSPQECQEFITYTEGLGYEAAPITTSRGFEMRPDIRNNARLILNDTERSAWLWQRIVQQMPMVVNGRPSG